MYKWHYLSSFVQESCSSDAIRKCHLRSLVSPLAILQSFLHITSFNWYNTHNSARKRRRTRLMCVTTIRINTAIGVEIFKAITFYVLMVAQKRFTVLRSHSIVCGICSPVKFRINIFPIVLCHLLHAEIVVITVNYHCNLSSFSSYPPTTRKAKASGAKLHLTSHAPTSPNRQASPMSRGVFMPASSD